MDCKPIVNTYSTAAGSDLAREKCCQRAIFGCSSLADPSRLRLALEVSRSSAPRELGCPERCLVHCWRCRTLSSTRGFYPSTQLAAVETSLGGMIVGCLMGPGIRYPTGKGHSVDLTLSHETTYRLITVHLQGARSNTARPFANATRDLAIGRCLLVVSEIHARTP